VAPGTRPIRKVLIANRGEIAVRVIRSCRELGIHTVAVYSDADRAALHVRMADEAFRVGPPPSRESYLSFERILDAAKTSGADAIHPGYGFLSENAAFVRACEAAGMVFIGPPASAMDAMGEKTRARANMEKAGVPVVPGSTAPFPSVTEARAYAVKIGFPVMLKAAGGGGGKGMRRVERVADFDSAWRAAKSEALNAFGNDAVYLEQYLEEPHHVEIQVFADQAGNTVHLNERECSAQRRHQKVIEETPSPILSPEMRAAMGEVAVRAARAVSYVGAGTVEFLVDRHRNFYFLEMNTRLQVEHPVTEWVTGLDLVAWQIRVARGEPLGFRTEPPRGTASRFASTPRIRRRTSCPARDGSPTSAFPPARTSATTRACTRIHGAHGLRPDDLQALGLGAVRPGRGPDATGAPGVRGEGNHHQHPLPARHPRPPRVRGRHLRHRLPPATPLRAARAARPRSGGGGAARGSGRCVPARCAAAAEPRAGRRHQLGTIAVADEGTREPPMSAAKRYLTRVRGARESVPVDIDDLGDDKYVLKLRGVTHTVDARVLAHGAVSLLVDGRSHDVELDESGDQVQALVGFELLTLDVADERAVRLRAGAVGFSVSGKVLITAPMPGKVVRVLVVPGAQVTEGEGLVVVEAMKMENELKSPKTGTVIEVFAKEGSAVEANAKLLTVE
jgi:acetyl/propionyl-CoA carboxylase alpha subunit